MKKEIKIFHIDAFTKIPFQGNAAAVTFGNGLTREEMQSIAFEMNLSETAFLSKSEKADFKLQWFTPKLEVQLCGHATIASLHFLKENGLIKDKVTFETLSGILKCEYKEGKYSMQIPLYKSREYNGDKEKLASALGVSLETINHNKLLVMENGNLYIHISSLEKMKNISPDFKSLKQISDIEGIVLFTTETIEPENNAHLRYFTPWYGIDEDPVTGSANGPLLLIMQQLNLIEGENDIHLNFEQGDFLNRKGRIGVHYLQDADELYISGDAVTIIKGELLL